MAKQELQVDFKDDVLQAAMAGKRKYRVIQNEDGTISLEDVTEYSQVGSNFGASQMNATNMAVNESLDKNKVIDSLSDIEANEVPGYAAGALAVRELNGKIEKPTLYSSAEKQIGVTDSGEPIYRKTIYANMGSFKIPSSGYQQADIGTGVVIGKLFNISCHIIGFKNYALPYCGNGTAWGTWLNTVEKVGTQHVLRFYNNVNWGSGYTLVATIDYTK